MATTPTIRPAADWQRAHDYEDIRYEIARTHIGDASRLSPEALRAAWAEMEADGQARLKATGPALV